MVTTHNLGFPRIGAARELKFALERYWQGQSSQPELEATAQQLRERHWRLQSGLEWVPVGDFSLYDQVLDMSVLLGNIPARADTLGAGLDQYFALARGQSQGSCCGIHAAEMTKWFDTNYHYLVPEFQRDTLFQLNPERLLAQLAEAKAQGLKPKPVIIGPVTYLALGKARDGSDPLDLLDKLLPVYQQLLRTLAEAGAEWIQVDEPILVTELDEHWQHALARSYHSLQSSDYFILLATYFGRLGDNLRVACELPVQGLHIDAVCNRAEVAQVVDWLPAHKILSLGVVSGRNIWKTDLNATLDWLEPIHEKLLERLWLAPSCSLLHVPVDLEQEQQLDPDIKNWLAFAVQKLAEVRWLSQALTAGRESVAAVLADNRAALAARRQSPRVHNAAVRAAVRDLPEDSGQRRSGYSARARKQAEILQLPSFPTTTIGSFPQTDAIRKTRRAYKQGELSDVQYRESICAEIRQCIAEQEALGLDVLVHGEAERNDMVEYFGEQLQGFVFSQFGWVQSYGSRCVKPPILFGDISRPQAMTVAWTRYAQQQTRKPVKGMLTGPVTLLNWSFVRDDQPRRETCLQLALAVREEVLDLEAAGTRIIQIDEAALREGLPLRRSEWQAYLDWAVAAFRISANGVRDETQIHTHMCYSEFNDIIEAIIALDADVITIENSRSNSELLQVFEQRAYPNGIGPGVYDIHSPNVPAAAAITTLLEQALKAIPLHQLWVNPDCGLKTRRWEEVTPALQAMVDAARSLRERQLARAG